METNEYFYELADRIHQIESKLQNPDMPSDYRRLAEAEKANLIALYNREAAKDHGVGSGY